MTDTIIIESTTANSSIIETSNNKKELIEITDAQIVEVIEGHIVLQGVASQRPDSFEYSQSVASDIWFISHNMLKFPSVTIVDSSGREVDGEVRHINNKSLECRFTQPFSGKAYLN